MSDEAVSARARDLLAYDPATGVFRWKRGSSGAPAGAEAGHITRDGYRSIKMDGQPYFAHRLAWLIVKGEFPTLELDHKNRDRADNRIVNLREATSTQNHANSSVKLGASGYRGVYFNKAKQKYHARIRVGRKAIHVGSFDLPEAAAAAAALARSEQFGEFAA